MLWGVACVRGWLVETHALPCLCPTHAPHLEIGLLSLSLCP